MSPKNAVARPEWRPLNEHTKSKLAPEAHLKPVSPAAPETRLKGSVEFSEPDRVLCLVEARAATGAYVLYWMQKSQRASDNPALSAAVAAANALELPLLVLFIRTNYPGATLGHYRFMLDGLLETAQELRSRGAAFRIEEGHPPAIVAKWAAEAAIVFCDAGRLRIEREWRAELARKLALAAEPRPLYEVESEAVVPPRIASVKDEWSAATFRKKITEAIPHYLEPSREENLVCAASRLGLDKDLVSRALSKGEEIPSRTGDRSAELSFAPEAGNKAARLRFRRFLEKGLEKYAEAHGDPAKSGGSGMSAYLHFGQISARFLGHAAIKKGGLGATAFIEQLVVRRELAVNFVLRNADYDRYEGLPDWARRSLAEAANDKRDFLYTRSEFEAAATHDPYWNAAQDEMVLTGAMHGYMRMYWGKKILEWSRDPESAFETALFLNDRYSLDGRDPNGYAGVAWCFGKHDRPWKGRPVFGTIRYMNDRGLKRKFDMDNYLERVAKLKKRR